MPGDLSAEQQQLFMGNPETREARRAERLTALPLPIPPLRGRKRALSADIDPTIAPPRLPNEVITRLGKLLKREKPLLNDFTKFGAPEATAGAIGLYAMGGNMHNHRKGSTPEERAEINRAKQRQTQHIADQLQHGFGEKRNAARLHRGALQSVRYSLQHGLPLVPEAALFAADAIEDFGLSLRERPDVTQRTGYDGDIAHALEHLGSYAVDHPEALGEQPDILRLVQIEAAKRFDYWDERLHVSITSDRDRSTAVTREQDVYVDMYLGLFETYYHGSTPAA